MSLLPIAELESPESPPLPQVTSVDWTVNGRQWQVRFSRDLQPCIASADTLIGEIAADLQDELDLAQAGPFRTVIDACGALLAAAVDPLTNVIVLGSPRFGHERFLLAAHADWRGTENRHRHAKLTELVQAWDTASATAAPLDIDRLARDCEMLNWWQPQGITLTSLTAIHTETERVARQLAGAMDDHRPSLRERISQWGLELTTEIAVLRVHLLRFVAALPALDHDVRGAEVARLLRETLRRMLSDDEQLRHGQRESEAMPTWMVQAVGLAARVTAVLPQAWVARATRAVVRAMARTFIAGEDMHRAHKALDALAKTNRDATIDQLGELVVSEVEADTYRDRVLALIAGFAENGTHGRTNAGIPRAHVSIKTSALCSDYDPDDPEGVWMRVGPRLQLVLMTAKTAGVFIHFDAEHYLVRNLTFTIMRKALMETPSLRQWPDVGIVVQAYLRDAGVHIRQVIDFAKLRGVAMPIRLVKGAYWDAETIEASVHDTLAPQFLNKAETDAAYQLLTLTALQASEHIQLCLGSHNLRDHCFAEAARSQVFPTAPPIEHQALHMTYEALSAGMARLGWAVRNYIPVGSLLVGMAYLVRRILENSSQVGVLTAARNGVDLTKLLVTPRQTLDQLRQEGQLVRPSLVSERDEELPFRNVAPLLLDRPEHRAALQRAIDQLVPVDADDPARSGVLHAVQSPSAPESVVGHIRFASAADVTTAVGDAVAAGQAWAGLLAAQRAIPLVRAAERLRAERPAWAALIGHESGKARGEALGDVDEAIDFMHYYARQAVHHANLHPHFAGLGAIAVIAPWNFPLAIPVGMATASLAAGNTVLLKSAEQTPLVVDAWVRLLHECGVPVPVLTHLPGDGPHVGAPLTADSRIAGVVFTGSQTVGCLLHRRVGPRVFGQQLPRVITEMGGKNAIVVTANADLDQAVSGCLRSAFGHAGQKCSACSRIIVDARIAVAFTERFCSAARDLQLGMAHTAGTRVNPVVSAEDQQRLRVAAAEIALEVAQLGGRVLLDRSSEMAGPLPQKGATSALLVGPIIAELPASAAMDTETFACKELFGPVVHIVAVADLQQAVSVWRAPQYALTGGIFAQSQDDVDTLAQAAHVGNLYVNRPITGARVAIEPFGGFAMSGTGPKAGGADYLPALTAQTVAHRRLDADALALLAQMPTTPPSLTSVAESELPTSDAAANGHLRALELHSVIATAHWCRDEGDRRHLLAICRAVASAFDEPNRKIAGQTSDNQWFLPKGSVAILAGSSAAGTFALAHAVAALAVGNRVRVLACSRAAVQVWSAVAADLALGVEVRDVADAPALADALTRHGYASVVLDGAPVDWQPALPVVLVQRARDRQLRQVLAAGSWPPISEAVAVLRCHMHVKTVVVNTMRHGAELGG
ncbi:MAG: aldehyde dehydrogenase family protein [Myxococcales bacterium]|nr:aldehyde dehydrogenase family protein [Myxococcales bacterium]